MSWVESKRNIRRGAWGPRSLYCGGSNFCRCSDKRLYSRLRLTSNICAAAETRNSVLQGKGSGVKYSLGGNFPGTRTRATAVMIVGPTARIWTCRVQGSVNFGAPVVPRSAPTRTRFAAANQPAASTGRTRPLPDTASLLHPRQHRLDLVSKSPEPLVGYHRPGRRLPEQGYELGVGGFVRHRRGSRRSNVAGKQRYSGISKL